MNESIEKPVSLTGDRPTGPLHLGHFVGSLKNRVLMQETHRQFVLIADSQALTDNAHDVGKVRRNVYEVALDYLSVGLDPNKSTIFVQSAVPAITRLSMLYLNFVTVSRLERNPTIRDEIKARGFERAIPAGFLCYPIAQAADITAFKSTAVPVGEDQAPLIEQTNEIVKRINNQIGRDVLPEARAIIPRVGRLPGIDGRAKMSKSSGNSIPLSASAEDVRQAVHRMYTDPNHIKVSDPGTVEGNVVFTYLDAFDPDRAAVIDLKAHYRRGGLGDVVLKKRLAGILDGLLQPIREKRAELARNPSFVMDVLKSGTEKAKGVAEETCREVCDGLGVFAFD